MAQTLLDTTSLATQAGLTLIVFAMTNALRQAFDLSAKWVGLAIAVAVCLTVALTQANPGNDPTVLRVLVGLGNGCLIYLAANGSNAAIGNRNPDPTRTSRSISTKDPAQARPPGSGFFRPW